MQILKKASIDNLLNNGSSDYLFSNGTSLLEHYKEFELFLTKDFFYESTYDKKVENLKDLLNIYRASVKAIHCPDSIFRTSSNSCKELSTNYLSLDEAIYDIESRELLKKTIEFAEQLNNLDSPIIVILHAGSIEGCDENTLLEKSEEKINDFLEFITEIKLEKNIHIAIENVTPYYDVKHNSVEIGKNSGWGEKYFEDIRIIEKINESIKKAGNENSHISFGLCIDFCHLIVDYNLKEKENYCSCIRYIESFMGKIENSKQKMYLFHISNMSKNGNHGALFSYTDDNELLHFIKTKCLEYPNAPVTFEMADGMDIDKACENFDNMVCLFSCMHNSGTFGEFLRSNNKASKELKQFFDNLFELYSIPLKNIEKIKENAWKVKMYILNNSNTDVNGKSPIFNFSRDMDSIDTALLRLKAYIFYTRFCNLGIYISKIYKDADFLTDNEEDFALSMLYFMFDDNEIRQCSYTGVGFAMNIDFLPKRALLFRFNDDIPDSNVSQFAYNEEQGENRWFNQLIENVRKQINGCKLMYSCGKNFYPCLYKYYNMNSSKNWHLRVYDNLPINYFKMYNKLYSVPAFLHLNMYNKGISEIDFSLDLSAFRYGRNSLSNFFTSITTDNKDIIMEKVGSIEDGEVVTNYLPSDCKEYKLSLKTALVLINLCQTRHKGSIKAAEVTVKENENKRLKILIDESNNADINQINGLLKYIKNIYSFESYESLEKFNYYNLDDFYKNANIKLAFEEDGKI